jgi:hypothetical protein
MNKLLTLFVIILFSVRLSAQPIQVEVTNRSGTPMANVLTIIRSSDAFREKLRVLTNSKGLTPKVNVKSGFYQVIAACPWGLCVTSIQEFIVDDHSPHVIKVPVDYRSTDEVGILVGGHKTMVQVSPPAQTGKAKFAALLVRDNFARYQQWYKVDADGRATIEVPEIPSAIVVWWDDKVFHFDVADHCSSHVNRTTDTGSCVELTNEQMRLGDTQLELKLPFE